MQTSAIQSAMPGLSETKQVAALLEQAFLEEMLKHAGPKPMDGAFSGGIGEEQFSGFLTQEYARFLAQTVDLGLENRLHKEGK